MNNLFNCGKATSRDMLIRSETGIRKMIWNDYKVLEDGTILNKDGTIKELKMNAKGYLFSAFYYNGKLHTHLAHRVVAEAYLGPCPEGYEVDHIDNNRANNSIRNLRYVTKSENNQKSYDSGNRIVSGFHNANSRYTHEQLSRVVLLLGHGYPYGRIQKLTGVNKGTVAKIAQGKHFMSPGRSETRA